MTSEAFREDPVIGAKHSIVIPDDEIFFTESSSVSPNECIIVLAELPADIIEIDFSEFGPGVVSKLVLQRGVESLVETVLKVAHGQ